MALNVRVPQPLRGLTGGASTVQSSGGTLNDCVSALEASYPGMRDRLLGEGGGIRRFVNIFVNGDDVRFLSGLKTELKDGDEVSIVPAVAGG